MVSPAGTSVIRGNAAYRTETDAACGGDATLPVTALAWSPDNTRLLVLYHNGVVGVWDSPQATAPPSPFPAAPPPRLAK